MLSDEAFANELLQMEEQVQAMADGELSEDELEEVAGGFVLIGIISSLIAGAIISGVDIQASE